MIFLVWEYWKVEAIRIDCLVVLKAQLSVLWVSWIFLYYLWFLEHNLSGFQGDLRMFLCNMCEHFICMKTNTYIHSFIFNNHCIWVRVAVDLSWEHWNCEVATLHVTLLCCPTLIQMLIQTFNNVSFCLSGNVVSAHSRNGLLKIPVV